MKRNLAFFGFLLALAGFVSTSASAGDKVGVARPVDPLVVIESDFNGGLLTLDEKVLLQIQAIKTPSKLPLKYLDRGSAPFRIPSRQATIILRDIWMQLDQLQPSTRKALAEAFMRKTTEMTYGSPGGNFLLHYDTLGEDSVPKADDDFNGLPDFIDHIAAYLDSSLDKSVELGYFLPESDGTSGGDSRTDVYFAQMSSYGFAFIEGGGADPWSDAFGYLTLNSDFVGFPPNDDPEGDILGAAKATVAHELHHLVQFAYDFSEPSWFIEMDAVHIEDLTFDLTNDNFNYLDSFFVSPGKSLMDNSIHKYSAFIYPLFLSQFFDTSLMKAVWEGARFAQVFNCLSDSLLGKYGWTQDSAFAEFAVWNYITAVRDDGLHHEEAADYPLITVGNQHSIFPVPVTNSPTAPAGYAAGYIEFFPPATPNILRLTFNGANSSQWAAFLIKSTSESVHEVNRLQLDGANYFVEIEIEDAQDYYRITLVGVNLTEFGAGALFSYSAESYEPRAVSASIATLYPVVYSGNVRTYQYHVHNPAPLDDVYDISYWDDSGWIVPDTVRVAIPHGNTYILARPYGPPHGTAIGHAAQLSFAVHSVNNTTIVDSQSIIVETVLQHADLNFSGVVDISDLTYLVNHMFKSGPPPVPSLLAGDFSCDGVIDISDLTKMVAYQFKAGSPPPCNPY